MYLCLFSVIKMAAESDFVFEDWCKRNELNETTITALQSKGFETELSLSVLCTEDIRSEFKKLLPAQVLLVERAMRDFHTAKMDNQDKQDNLPPLNAASASTLTQTASASTSMPTRTAFPATSTPTQTMSVSEVLQRCGLQEQADTGEGKQGFDEIYPATDPYGLGAGPHANRHRDVGKFITFHAAHRTDHDEQVVSIGGIQFRAADEQKVPLDKIGPQQYMEGSLAILRDMIVHENMALPRVLGHVNYLIQIARFSQTFPWQSVFEIRRGLSARTEQPRFPLGNVQPRHDADAVTRIQRSTPAHVIKAATSWSQHRPHHLPTLERRPWVPPAGMSIRARLQNLLQQWAPILSTRQ